MTFGSATKIVTDFVNDDNFIVDERQTKFVAHISRVATQRMELASSAVAGVIPFDETEHRYRIFMWMEIRRAARNGNIRPAFLITLLKDGAESRAVKSDQETVAGQDSRLG